MMEAGALSRQGAEVKSGRQEFEKLAMEKTKKTPRKTLPAGIAKVLKRLHYPVAGMWRTH
jgi:hypothetical protein